MGARGRKSSEADAVVIVGSFGTRPEPPEELTDRQSEIWRETVSSEPPDFFNTAALRALLMDYCRHRESAENVSSIINSFQAEWLKSQDGAKRYQALLRMRDMETRAAAQIATKLRLTNQSRYTPQAAATAAKNTGRGQRPWEI
jgi:hypothetical protein